MRIRNLEKDLYDHFSNESYQQQISSNLYRHMHEVIYTLLIEGVCFVDVVVVAYALRALPWSAALHCVFYEFSFAISG